MQLPQNFQLDSIKVYSQRNQFEYAQTTITVAPKVMQTLVVLAKHAPETVSREQLFEEVWGNVVVSDEALSRVISDLRQCLGDSSQRSVYIETVKKVGYRLIQEPKPIEVESKVYSKSGTGVLNVYSSKTALVGISFLLVTLLVGLLGWQLFDQGTAKKQFSTGIKRQPLTSSQGIDGDPRFSKDGDKVVYKSIGRDGNTDIFLKRLGEQQRTQLTITAESEISPVFSPDGKRIAFIRSPLKHCKIMVLNLATGTEQELKTCSNGNWRSLDWSVDGTTLATDFINTKNNRKMVELLRFPEGETIEYVEAIDPNSGTGHPRFSPNGQKLLFIEGSLVSGNESVQLLDLGSKERQTLLKEDDLIFGLAWIKSSDAFVYITSGTANSGLWYRHLDDDVGQLLHSGAVEDVDVNWHTGNIVVTEAQRDSNIWSVSHDNSLDGNNLHPLDKHPDFNNLQRKAVVNSSAKDYFPAISPDGQKLAYVSERSGFRELWLKSMVNDTDVQLTEFAGGLVLMPRWDQESRKLIFTYRDESGSKLYSFNLAERRLKPIATGGDAARFGFWMEQDNQLAWSSKYADGWTFNVAKADPNSDSFQTLLSKVVFNPMQIPGEQISGEPLQDSGNIYYSDILCHCVLALNTKTGEESNTGLDTWEVFPDSWLITKDYYYRYEATARWTENQLIRIERKSGEITQLATFKRFLAYDYPTLSWHQDSHVLYYTTIDDIQSDLWLYNLNDH